MSDTPNLSSLSKSHAFVPHPTHHILFTYNAPTSSPWEISLIHILHKLGPKVNTFALTPIPQCHPRLTLNIHMTTSSHVLHAMLNYPSSPDPMMNIYALIVTHAW